MRRLAVVLTAFALLAAACGDGDDGAAQDPSESPSTTAPSSDGATSTTGGDAAASDAPSGSAPLAVTDVATDLDTVWAMAFDPAGKLWFTQRDGRLQQVGGKGRDIPGVVAYASDMTLLDSILLPHHDASWDRLMMASLDHAMWFHRPFRADEWFLYDQASPSASGARGLARGSIFRADGTLAISVMQEGLVRLVGDPPRGQ